MNWKAKIETRRMNEIMMICFIILLALGVQKTWAGIHDIDNSWNLVATNCQLNGTQSRFVEIRMDGTYATELGAYMQGLIKVSYGTTTSIIAAVFLGYVVGRRYYEIWMRQVSERDRSKKTS